MSFIIILASLLLVIGCGRNNDSMEEKFFYIIDPVRVYHDSFSIVKPTDWQEVEYGGGWIYMPAGGSFVDLFSEKMIITAGFLSKDDTLENIALADIAKSRNLYPALQVVETGEDFTIGQFNGLKTVFTSRIDGKILLVTQVRIIKDDKIYLFVQQCKSDACINSNIFTEMILSFR